MDVDTPADASGASGGGGDYGDDGNQVGFVSGVVDHPITEQQRADGVVGHTIEQWLAYNDTAGRGAGKYPLRDNHGRAVGRLLQTWVDHEQRLCASALIDPAHKELRQAVQRGEVPAFSIGFDAVPIRNAQSGRWEYKNHAFEVSLTKRPRKEFARIQVRCSEPEMADQTTSTPVAAPVPSPPVSSGSPAPAATTAAAAAAPVPTQPSSTATETPAVKAEPPADGSLAAAIREQQEKARLYDEMQQKKQKKREEKYRAEMEAGRSILLEEGMDLDNEGEKRVLSTLLQTNSALPQAITRVAGRASRLEQQLKESKAELERHQAELQEKERALMQARAVMGLLGQSQSSPQAPVANSLEALLALDRSLFARASDRAAADQAEWQLKHAPQLEQVRASAAAPNALTGATAAPTPAAEKDEPVLEMPADPLARCNLGFRLVQAGIPMPQQVRCSAGTEAPVAQQVRERSRRYGIDCSSLPDAYLDAMFSEQEFWDKRAVSLGGTWEDSKITAGHRNYERSFPNQHLYNGVRYAHRR